MNGQAIPGAEMNTFRLTNVILERIIFVSQGITVHILPLSVLIDALNKASWVKTNSRTTEPDYKLQDPRMLDIRYCGGYLIVQCDGCN